MTFWQEFGKGFFRVQPERPRWKTLGPINSMPRGAGGPVAGTGRFWIYFFFN
jgi:hypothetical protein